jgi:AraC-like DNA-binding protein
MPVVTIPLPATERFDGDAVQRPIVTLGLTMPEADTIEIDFHRHRKGQFLLVQRGALSCEVEGGLWIVPPRSAIWIPHGALHAIKATGVLEGYNAFVAPDLGGHLPASCCTVSVKPLLRELLIRSASLPAWYDEGGVESRLVAVLLDEIAAAQIEDLHLPMPSDRRLRDMVEQMIDAPAERETMQAWAQRAGLSERTMARRIAAETGMGFARWRRQLNVMLAVKWLAGGASIQTVANDLGYDSIPSFTTMFRKATGVPPGRYMAERHSGGNPA